MHVERPACQCAVSLRLLRAFMDHVRSFTPSEAQQAQAQLPGSLVAPWPPHPQGLTTKQVVEWIVKPRTAAKKLRFVDVLDAEPEDVGRPDYFISHAWGRPFAETIGMVLQHLASAEDSALVWLDCFAINQHQTSAEELQQFAVAIGHSVSTLVCLDADATPLKRIWCL